MSPASQVLQLARVAAVTGVACGLPLQAIAAVNVCEKVHASEAAEDKSEILAKKRALENWVAHARRYGEDFARWGNAWERHFECSRTDSGLFRCKAVARPCAVRQVPPDGLKPLRRDPGT
jgi:hypothetical protein